MKTNQVSQNKIKIKYLYLETGHILKKDRLMLSSTHHMHAVSAGLT